MISDIPGAWGNPCPKTSRAFEAAARARGPAGHIAVAARPARDYNRRVLEHCARDFIQLIVTPFRDAEMVWGIVPLYFGWLLNEMTSDKPSFRTAIQTGFSFVWAAAHWTYPYFAGHRHERLRIDFNGLLAVNAMVTLLIFVFGLVALVSGLRRKYPPYCSFLGHTRFSNYFMIAIFPIQSPGYLKWSWDYVIAIAVFAVPVWLLMHFGMKPLRKGK
ncbi:MAG TPA: hypothetical protein VHH73_15595 [Verrucomicrobiae bacterium]|nr:hypothetical protein [Verrucomicrobiae bacterium]